MNGKKRPKGEWDEGKISTFEPEQARLPHQRQLTLTHQQQLNHVDTHLKHSFITSFADHPLFG